jgi:uncharacterized repeat protein (TIGR03803 family)
MRDCLGYENRRLLLLFPQRESDVDSREAYDPLSPLGANIMIRERSFLGFGAWSALLLAWACMASPVRGGGLTALASFNGTNGSATAAGVTFDADGNLYGTASYGGANNQGTVWDLAKGSGTITPLASFNGTNGINPYAGVTLDTNGNLYGTTIKGGSDNQGTVWELANGSGAITPLASFNGTNGGYSYANVTLDANGNLYGTASAGGANSLGTVWELAKGSSTITVLASFNGTNGAEPVGGVTFDTNGNLFGTSLSGGADGRGTVWELAKGGGTINSLPSFINTNGSNPSAGVTFDANGNLYGTTQVGGSANQGTVWELAKGSGTITALASFDVINGAAPGAGVTFDANGNLYGTAQVGGADGYGTVWELAKGSDALTVLAPLSFSTGTYTVSSVTLDAHGNLYGTAPYGGAYESGTVWELSSVPEPSSLVMGLISLVLAGGALLQHHRRP